jgi:nitroimidazol reductase NimA-like FMN-containing flavoprotein (pyridoxamine 5'-phosphate oxidase superfamily)
LSQKGRGPGFKPRPRLLQYFVEALPRFSALVTFSEKELGFLKRHEVCRLATASRNAVSHVTPVIYAMDGNAFGRSSRLWNEKMSHLMQNNNVSLVVDDYNPNRAVVVQGKVEVYERDGEYVRLPKTLSKRFELYRENPWRDGECPP